jgi:hypothetical protein
MRKDPKILIEEYLAGASKEEFLKLQRNREHVKSKYQAEAR